MLRIKKRNKNVLKKILLLLVTIILLVLFFEIIARIMFPFYSNYDTEMWRYAKELKKESDNPILSHEHKPNSEADLYGVNIKINSDGFRDYEYGINKEKNAFRILALGDSITLGWGVEFEDTFPKLLEQILNNLKPSKKYSKYEVINLGIGNYNTEMELIRLKEKGLKYNPDLIILEYYINDAEITLKKSKFNVFRYSYLYVYLWDKYQNIKVKFLGNNYITFYSNLYKDDFIGKENARNALYEFISISKERDIPILIVVFPEFHNFKDYQFNYVTDFVFEIANSQNVAVLDLLPYYIDYDPGSIWVSYEDAHPNALGNKIAADAIYGKIIEQSLIG